MNTMLDESQYNHEDWQLDKSVVECNRIMFEREIMCDVEFLLTSADETEVVLRANKFVLVSRSPVFYAMFCGSLAEQGRQVQVKDIQPDAFRQLIRYLYCEEFNLNPETVVQVLYASKKYMVPRLSNHCIKYLERELAPENVPIILEQCLLYEEAVLKKKCLTMIEEHTPQVLQSTAFLQVSTDTLCTMLALDVMTISELELFHCVINWAKYAHEANSTEPDEDEGPALRRLLGQALYLVRIPCMKIDDFANEVLPQTVLTMEEENTIFRYFTQRKKPEHIPFVSAPRSESSVYLELGSEELDIITRVNFATDDKSAINFFNCPPIKLRDIFVFCPVLGDQHMQEEALADTTLQVEITEAGTDASLMFEYSEFLVSPIAIHGQDVMRFSMDASLTKEIEWTNWSLSVTLKLPESAPSHLTIASLNGPQLRTVKNYQLGRKKLTFCCSNSGILSGLSFLFCE